MESASLEEVCRIIFIQLIEAMHYPNIASIKIELDGKQFVSDRYDKDYKRQLRKDIVVHGKACGWIAIFYSDDQPFLLPEEQNLIDVIGDDLGKWLEHRQAEARILIEQELRVRDAAIREFAAHVERMREEDRKYIAREIHDELGQLLAALHLEISLLKGTADENNKNEKIEIIRRNMAELVDRADQSVRSVAEHLRPASLGLGIASALKKLTGEFRKHSGMSCALRLMPEPIDLEEDQTVAIFRIVQESLTNVARHAEASCVEVSLFRSTDHLSAAHLIVEVRDNGRGFDPGGPANKKSFGLIGMRERAAVLGGNIDIVSGEEKQGTVISLRLPLKGNDRTS
jgi:signal transduction histidine kinase